MITPVCPKCQNTLLRKNDGYQCTEGDMSFFNNDFLVEWDSPNFDMWKKLQEHGILSYNIDPVNNLSIDYGRQDVEHFMLSCLPLHLVIC